MTTSVSLGRHLTKVYPTIIGGKGLYLFTLDDRIILDASSGAAVACLGYGNEKVISAINELLNTGTPYVASTF
jgi:adenosylmethionine-8-amino-7-oxononanoate aminotransferase